MKKLPPLRKLLPFLLALGLAGCGFNPLSTVTNPVNTTNLYQGELVFDGALKTFNAGKDLCVRRIISSTCRTYVVKGQKMIVQIAAADQSARKLVDSGTTTINVTNAVQTFVGLVSTFDATAVSLSKVQ